MFAVLYIETFHKLKRFLNKPKHAENDSKHSGMHFMLISADLTLKFPLKF